MLLPSCVLNLEDEDLNKRVVNPQDQAIINVLESLLKISFSETTEIEANLPVDSLKIVAERVRQLNCDISELSERTLIKTCELLSQLNHLEKLSVCYFNTKMILPMFHTFPQLKSLCLQTTQFKYLKDIWDKFPQITELKLYVEDEEDENLDFSCLIYLRDKKLVDDYQKTNITVELKPIIIQEEIHKENFRVNLQYQLEEINKQNNLIKFEIKFKIVKFCSGSW